MDLADKTAVVTGAGRGIGRAIAVRLGRSGARIALIDVNEEELEASSSELKAAGIVAGTYPAYVSSETQVARAMGDIVRDFGSLDVLVNNAAIVRDALLVKVEDGKVVGKMSLADWQAVLDVDLTGVFLCGREAVQRMLQLGNGGVIVNISSISRHGNIGQSNYRAAKAGVVALTATWAKELARHRIRTGAIAPGGTRTEIICGMRPQLLLKLLERVPLQRLAEPAEIAEAAAFIIGNEFFTGRCIDLDGGTGL
jgi:3-oxoacyl-[acyl-carrier protein] reductase